MSWVFPRTLTGEDDPIPPLKHWLVCPSITEGTRTVSNLRECRCGTQLWVAIALVSLVDSGHVVPQCSVCRSKMNTDPDDIIAVIY